MDKYKFTEDTLDTTPKTDTLSETESKSDNSIQCRVCLSTSNEVKIYCKCTSSGFCKKCLDDWIKNRPDNQDKYLCELCKEKFTVSQHKQKIHNITKHVKIWSFGISLFAYLITFVIMILCMVGFVYPENGLYPSEYNTYYNNTGLENGLFICGMFTSFIAKFVYISSLVLYMMLVTDYFTYSRINYYKNNIKLLFLLLMINIYFILSTLIGLLVHYLIWKQFVWTYFTFTLGSLTLFILLLTFGVPLILLIIFICIIKYGYKHHT